MTKLLSPTIRLAFAAGFSISIALSAARASGPIGGAIGSTTASANPLPGLPLNRDDKDITKTYDVAALSYSFLIADSVQAQFPGYDWVFAGAPSGPGSHFTPIDESAFYVSKYQPWVVNSPTLNSPGGTPYNRGVTRTPAG